MKRLLVTGASGLLGLNLALQARDRYDVTGTLRRERLAPGAKAPFTPIYTDLAQPGSVERALDEAAPDVVIHTAALTDIDQCEARPEEAQALNADLPEALAKAAARRGCAFVHISTDAVFDGRRGGYDENDAPCPINVYARTKLDGERRVAEANPGAIIARVNFYGWSWTGTRSLAEWFYHNLMAGRPIRGFANVLFCPLLVGDLVEILLKMVDLRLSGLYHAVSAEGLSKCDFGRMLARQFGFDESLVSSASYIISDLRAPRARSLTLSSAKLSAALGQPLPAQAEPMRRFHQQLVAGYPAFIRSVLAEQA